MNWKVIARHEAETVESQPATAGRISRECQVSAPGTVLFVGARITAAENAWGDLA